CEFDPEQIRTVVTNVIENAIKYSHADSDPVQIRFELKERWAMVVITDTGVGMDPVRVSLVLEPFYRLDPSRSKETGGYGLGLSLCKTIMDAHSGNIRIDSSPGRGTSVSLFLPLS
ncbi:MAG: ATP-binding protein, partial [Desulfobacterales bacterium]|nr:ATP-binding protein [Desulfobacterales bacterium]